MRSETTAESYFARSRYDRDFGAGYAFGGAGWDRNTFSGIQNRFSLVGGFGRTFAESDAARFKADIGLTYTIQKDVSPVAGADDAFAGARLSVDAMRQLSETTELTSVLTVDESLEGAEDIRADWVNSLSVSINSRLALKTSIQLLFDNEPAFFGVPLESAPGVPTGTEVPVQGDQVDSVMTLTLVIKL